MHGKANQRTKPTFRREMTRWRDVGIAIAMIGYGELLIIDENAFHYSRTVPQVKLRAHSEDSDKQNHGKNVGHYMDRNE